MDTHTNKKIPEKDGGAVCGSINTYLYNIFFFFSSYYLVSSHYTRAPSQ